MARAVDDRDQLVRGLRDSDPAHWSYGELARMLGCSRALVVQIVQRPGTAPPTT